LHENAPFDMVLLMYCCFWPVKVSMDHEDLDWPKAYSQTGNYKSTDQSH